MTDYKFKKPENMKDRIEILDGFQSSHKNLIEDLMDGLEKSFEKIDAIDKRLHNVNKELWHYKESWELLQRFVKVLHEKIEELEKKIGEK